MADMNKLDNILDGMDAIFLPGKIHGAEHQVYVLYMNWQANNENGSFEIEVMDRERLLKAYEESAGNCTTFFDILPDMFQGEWYYCDAGSEDFDELVDAYFDADFLVGRDGGKEDEMLFLVNWAKGE